jgi:hypothetical protein
MRETRRAVRSEDETDAKEDAKVQTRTFRDVRSGRGSLPQNFCAARDFLKPARK